MYEMLTGYSPFHGEDEDELFRSIQTNEVQYPSTVSPNANQCIRRFLERDPKKRLGMKTSPFGGIREQHFFTPVDWNRIERCEIEPPFVPKTVRSFFLKKIYFLQI